MRNFAELGVLAALCDTDPAAVTSLTTTCDIPAEPLDRILADPAIDAIAIAGPAATPAPIALNALAAGKHDFVEKPMALDIEAAEWLIESAENSNRVLTVGQCYRLKDEQTLEEIVDGR